MNNNVLHILSHDGSLEFKNEVENAELMVRNPRSNVPNLNAVHHELSEKINLLERELHNPAYSDHQIGVMETYIDKLNQVTRLLRVRIEQQGELQEVDGGRRKSGRRRTSRTRSGRRRTRKRRH